MFPLIQTLKASTRGELRSDVLAGLTTAVMLVPQAMAYAMLAGLDPIVGLYASTLPLALYALVGSSRPLAVGPVAMDSLMVAAGLLPLISNDPAQYATAAALLALMVGGIQLLMGLVKAGFLVRFLAKPVITGFTAAAAIIIGLSQLKSALGISLPRSQQVHVILIALSEKLGEIHPLTLGVTAISVITLVVLKKVSPRFPRFLLVVAAGTLTTWAFGLDQMGLAVVGEVPAGLPSISLPWVNLELVGQLFPIALAIALVAMMEAISVAKRYDEAGELKPNRELVGLGLANLASAMVGGYPITGGFSRTAVNAQAGAKSPLAGLVTAGVVVLVLVFLTQYFYFLPKAVLAAIIMSAVIGLVDVQGLQGLWKNNRMDFAVAMAAFVATLTLGIQIGMAIGVGASLIALLWRTATPKVKELGTEDGVLSVQIEGPLYFGNTDSVREDIAAMKLRPEVHQVRIQTDNLGSLDSTARSLVEELEKSATQEPEDLASIAQSEEEREHVA
jgi:SulP family sulfate permease